MSKKATDDLNPPDKSKLDELSLEIYEARVRDLTEKLTRSKEKCDTLCRENDALGRAQAKFSSDKQDIVEFLNIKVREHEEYISSLEQQIQRLEDEKRALEVKSKNDLENTIHEWKKELDHVQTQGAKYKNDLDMLSDFRGRKDDLEMQLKRSLSLIETREKEYKDVIHTMERKVLQDKNQMKKEMLQKVNEAVANFRRVADQQMAETTKRAIRENMAITSQLKKMSARTLELIAENEGYKAKMAKLKTSTALLTESEKDLARKNQANQRVIKMLLDRLKESDEMLELAYDQSTARDIQTQENEGESKMSLLMSSDSSLGTENLEILQKEYNRLLTDLLDIERVIQDLEATESENISARIQSLLSDRFVKEALSYRLLQLFGTLGGLPSSDQNAGIQNETSYPEDANDQPRPRTDEMTQVKKHTPIEREKPNNAELACVISAIPPKSAIRYSTAEPKTNSIGVQTLPIVFRAMNDGSAINLDSSNKTGRVMSLLSEVRPWGAPAMSLPKKGRLPKIPAQ
ncbi:hypothetical protein HDU77_000682 [Chytriomyces hyalinus]|nr:hypothetical protein HDU77_000682 [Chytriomyces hyalinus]